MPKTKFSIFFSWQSDTKGNRKIIRDSILAECQKQKEMNGYEVVIDEATRNLPGSPQIETSILQKIANSDVFICDITPIGNCNGKQMPNSNVIFELGYAFRAIGPERVIMLAKSGNWDVKDLPFDLNHRRIGIFKSAADCDLNYEIDSCINFCSKRFVRSIDWHKLRRWIDSLYSRIPSIKITTKKNSHEYEKEFKATETSTTFFARRMAEAFPGERDVVEFTNKKEIIKRLSWLLQSPMSFAPGLENASSEPVWIFRAGATEAITSFKIINRHKVLINNDELLIRRMVVYRHFGKYYSQYVYVEVDGDKPSGCYNYKDEDVKEIAKDRGYFAEEYAVFKPLWYKPERKISRTEYDDGSTIINGKRIHLNESANLRIRYLTPYNFIIAAKNSPYNCSKFDATSEKFFKGMLDGHVSNETFNDYMMRFPKREDF